MIPRGYVCYRASSPIVIDGKLDDRAWHAAPWTTSFVDIVSDASPRPRFQTRAKMLWDDEYFYVGADLQEPEVWATLTEHDSVIFHDNDFEVFIDPDGDNHQYYEIEINALATEWDLLLIKPYRDGGPPVNNWEIPGLRKATHVDGTINRPGDIDRGWSVEMAFPWSVLRECAHRPAPPGEGDQWRVNFSRVEWKVRVENGAYVKLHGVPEDNWVWSPQGAVNMHRPEWWGYVQFTRNEPDTTRFVPDPSWPIRELLMRVYYAQKDYFTAQSRWAPRLDALSTREVFRAPAVERLILEPNEVGFVASADLVAPGGTRQRWHVREDSRLWTEG